MRSAPLFSMVVILCFAVVTPTYGHPVAVNTTASITVTDPSVVLADLTVSGIEDASRNETGSRGDHHSSPVTIASVDVGCRKRVFCEAARTLTRVFPLSMFWQGIARPDPQNAYFDAWSRGLSSEDCSQLYPDCSDSPAGLVLSLANRAVGPKGFVGQFLERLTLPAGPNVPREPGAPRPSLVMQKLRTSQRQWEAAGGPPTSSDEFTTRKN